MDDETRWCDRGCGYRLLPEYGPDETTCGACLNEDEDRLAWTCYGCSSLVEEDEVLWADLDGTLSTGTGLPWCVGCVPPEEEV